MSKSTKQQAGSYRFVAPDVEAARAKLMGEPMAVGCQFCGESFEGAAMYAIAWARKHRLAAHPEAVDRGLRERKAAARVADQSPRVSL